MNLKDGSFNDYIVSNPGNSVLFFILITSIFYVIRLFILPKEIENTGIDTFLIILTVIYVGIIIIGNIIINITISTNMCDGIPQWHSVFIMTVIPWVLIFGIIGILINIYPGWKQPFSNTFGYLIVNLLGLKKLFNDNFLNNAFKDEFDGEKPHDKDEYQIGKIIQNIYGNQTLLINEIPFTESEVFINFIDKMINLKIFTEDLRKANDSKGDKNNIKTNIHVKALYKLLLIKDIIAEYIWFILAGILVTSISYNYIINISCEYSAKKMNYEYNKYLNNLNKNDDTLLDNYDKTEDLINS